MPGDGPQRLGAYPESSAIILLDKEGRCCLPKDGQLDAAEITKVMGLILVPSLNQRRALMAPFPQGSMGRSTDNLGVAAGLVVDATGAGTAPS